MLSYLAPELCVALIADIVILQATVLLNELNINKPSSKLS